MKVSTKYRVEEREYVVMFWFINYQAALAFKKLPKEYLVYWELNEGVNESLTGGECYRVAQKRLVHA